MVHIDKINKDLVAIQQELTSVSKDGNVVGRTIAKLGRRLEMGAKKIAHFLKTGDWKSNQSRNADKLNRVLDNLNIDIKLTRENILKLIKNDPKSADEYKEQFQQFSGGIAEQMRVVKIVIDTLKNHKEKLGENDIDILETRLAGVLENCSAIDKQVSRRAKAEEVNEDDVSFMFEKSKSTKKEKHKAKQFESLKAKRESFVSPYESQKTGKGNPFDGLEEETLPYTPTSDTPKSKKAKKQSEDMHNPFAILGEEVLKSGPTQAQSSKPKSELQIIEEFGSISKDLKFPEATKTKSKKKMTAARRAEITRDYRNKNPKLSEAELKKQIEKLQRGKKKTATPSVRKPKVEKSKLETEELVQSPKSTKVPHSMRKKIKKEESEKQALDLFCKAKGVTSVLGYVTNVRRILQEFKQSNDDANYINTEIQLDLLNNEKFIPNGDELNTISSKIRGFIENLFLKERKDLTPAIAKKI